MDIFSANSDKTLFSDDVLNMRRSPIRQLLSTADMDKLISFAGGYPDPVTFPIEDLKSIMVKVLDEYGNKALQYGPSEGYLKLRKILAERFNAQNANERQFPTKISHSNIIITTSSQQGIDITTRLFINAGDVVLCALPSYLGALQSFYSYRAEVIGITTSDNLYESYNSVISECIRNGKRVKFIYAIADFQNPSGETLSMQQRYDLISIAEKYDIAIVEDSPYREIRFEGESCPTLYQMCPNRVIQLNSFSKIFAPGFRLGWIIANEDVIDKIMVAKQSMDLSAPVFDQYVAAEYLESGKFDINLQKSVELYKKKKECIISCLEKYFDKNNPVFKNIKWTNPQGGLFLFMTLDESIDASQLFHKAVKNNVAFVAGELFHCNNSGKNTLRLNYSSMSTQKIEEGIKILSDIIKAELL